MPNYEAMARRAAKRYGVNPDIFVAQLRQESGLVPGKTSPAGASGIAQFMPGTAKSYGVNLNDGKVGDDLDGAARYMRDSLKAFGGDYRLALAAYNAGGGNARKALTSFPETRNYVKTILANAGQGGHPRASSSPAAPNVVTPQATRQATQPTGPTGVQVTNTQQPVDRSAERVTALLQYFKGGRYQAGGLPALLQSLQSLQNTPGSADVQFTGGGAQTPRQGVQGAVSGTRAGLGNGGKPRSTNIRRLGKIAQNRFGLHVGENEYFGGVTDVHTHANGGSYHYRDQNGDGKGDEAIDVSGDPKQMQAYAAFVAKKFGPDLEELIWRGKGARTKKYGKHVPKNYYEGHTDHVHVADADGLKR
jgi:hypothetical protein